MSNFKMDVISKENSVLTVLFLFLHIFLFSVFRFIPKIQFLQMCSQSLCSCVESLESLDN